MCGWQLPYGMCAKEEESCLKTTKKQKKEKKMVQNYHWENRGRNFSAKVTHRTTCIRRSIYHPRRSAGEAKNKCWKQKNKFCWNNSRCHSYYYLCVQHFSPYYTPRRSLFIDREGYTRVLGMNGHV